MNLERKSFLEISSTNNYGIVLMMLPMVRYSYVLKTVTSIDANSKRQNKLKFSLFLFYFILFCFLFDL